MAKSGILGKILMRWDNGRPLKIFEVFLYIFNYYFKKLSGTGKIIPIANVNRIGFVN